MKSYLLLVWLGCILPLGILAQVSVNCTPNLSPDVSVPVTTNSVFLKQPKCCFDGVPNLPCPNSTCEIWLASALDSAIGTFDAEKNNTNNYEVCPCSPGFNNTSKNYFLIKAGAHKDFPCDSKNPNIFKVGGESVCPSSTVCTGVLPEGALTRYKYLLVDPVTKKPVAETDWSSTTTLKTVKDPGSIGSGYAGRSAAMVVITSILSAVAGLLLLGLLGALIYTCCCRGGTAQNYTTRTTNPTKRQPSLMGSLRIPTYDVHHLKNPSPYDNPAYERDTKRYTTSTTLPKGAATNLPKAMITTHPTTVHSSAIHPDMNYSTTINSPTNKSTITLPNTNYSTTVLPNTNQSTINLPNTNYSTTINSPTKSTITLPNTNYSTTVLPNTNQSTITLPGANYSTSVLPNTNQSTITLPGANYSTSVLPNTNQSTIMLPSANYSTSVLPNTNQSTITLPGANYSTSVLPNLNQSTIMLPRANQSTIMLPSANQSTIIQPRTIQSNIIQPSSPETIRLQNLRDMTFQTDDYTGHHDY